MVSKTATAVGIVVIAGVSAGAIFLLMAKKKAGGLSVSASASPTAVQVGQPVSFTAVVTGGATPYQYIWEFGDGGSSSLQDPTHSYFAAGTYPVSLTVTDANGAVANGSASVVVSSTGGTSIFISVSPTLLPSTGGSIVVTGSTNLPDGTVMLVVAQGSQFLAQVLKATVVVTGGAFTSTFDIPANASSSPNVWAVAAYNNANQLQYSNTVDVTET